VVTHPFRDAGQFESRDEGAPFIVRGSYFDEGIFDETFTRGGLTMRFLGRTYPLSWYAGALQQAALLIEALPEPVGFDDRDRRMPEFLMLRAVKA
jgi:hypothetical protein